MPVVPSPLVRSSATAVMALAVVGSPWTVATLGDPGQAPTAVAGERAADAATGPAARLVGPDITARAGTTSGATQTIRFSVPAVLLGDGDGLPGELAAGSTYTLRLTVLAAEPGPAASVRVRARGARVVGCQRVPITTGTVAAVRCDLEVPPARPHRGVVVAVTAVGGAGTRVATVYRHGVR